MGIKVIITGATGMVGKGVLLESLDSPAVDTVLVINRKPVGLEHPKLREIIHADLSDIAEIREQVRGYDACFFCLGITSAGLSEADYRKITYDLTIAFAQTLVEENPLMTFCFISGMGTNSSENSRTFWPNVKGAAENALLDMEFPKKYMFRPGFIRPMRGVKSAISFYNAIYLVVNPLYPLLKRIFPGAVTTTVNVGRAMINSAIHGYNKVHLENPDINKLAEMK